jgi:hypothetical protein
VARRGDENAAAADDVDVAVFLPCAFKEVGKKDKRGRDMQMPLKTPLKNQQCASQSK